MHNNYFFINKLSSEIKTLLVNAELVECFSQNKDELILSFIRENNEEFYIQAHLAQDFSSLHFPKDFNRAKRNSVNLFEEIIGRIITDIRQIANERAFVVTFTKGFSLYFKLFGNYSNIVLYNKDNVAIRLFKKNLQQDAGLILNPPKVIDYSFENFKDNDADLKKTIPTLGPLPQKFLSEKDYETHSFEEKYSLLKALLEEINKGVFYISKIEEKAYLILFRYGTILEEHTSAIAAARAFYHAHYRINFIGGIRKQIENAINERIKSTKSYIANASKKLNELLSQTEPEKVADIIMANLHQIPPGKKEVTLFNFYTNDDITIKLKENLSPQRNAETLYKKGKNRHVQYQQLEAALASKDRQIEEFKGDLQALNDVNFYKDAELLLKKYVNKSVVKEDEESHFKVFVHENFKILVGRNAQNNDDLTQKFAHKNDLWLHAKDVQGSHVVIQHQPGKNFPKPVIEKAAALAAYYSKRKNESFCPVMYTQKKYVRKIKGAPKGAVKVEKETVIMVTPSEK
ncbi:MAG TPA: NFACT RNA binding domain-containing protein [Cytophagaceae bacterium]|jgi:predicted ribosome quality control (RQC) complex YloA/Tae2 family protein